MTAEDMQEAWAALRMIREAVETLGPVGCMPSEEHVSCHVAPTFMAEADAIVAGIMKMHPVAKEPPTSVDKESVCA